MQHAAVDIPVIESLPGLPYSRYRDRFRLHLKGCEPCALVHEERGECYDYCRMGHALIHQVQDNVDRMNAVAALN